MQRPLPSPRLYLPEPDLHPAMCKRAASLYTLSFLIGLETAARAIGQSQPVNRVGGGGAGLNCALWALGGGQGWTVLCGHLAGGSWELKSPEEEDWGCTVSNNCTEQVRRTWLFKKKKLYLYNHLKNVPCTSQHLCHMAQWSCSHVSSFYRSGERAGKVFSKPQLKFREKVDHTNNPFTPKYFVNQTFGNRCQNVSVTERNGNNALKAWMSQQPWQILPTSSNYSRLKRTYPINIWEGDLAWWSQSLWILRSFKPIL